MIEIVIELVAGLFVHGAKKKYYLSPDELNEPIRAQSLCYLNKNSSLLVLTEIYLIFFKIKFGKRTLLSAIPIQEITKCKRDFWGKLVVETRTERFSITLESSKKWEKLIRRLI